MHIKSNTRENKGQSLFGLVHRYLVPASAVTDVQRMKICVILQIMQLPQNNGQSLRIFNF